MIFKSQNPILTKTNKLVEMKFVAAALLAASVAAWDFDFPDFKFGGGYSQ